MSLCSLSINIHNQWWKDNYIKKVKLKMTSRHSRKHNTRNVLKITSVSLQIKSFSC